MYHGGSFWWKKSWDVVLVGSLSTDHEIEGSFLNSLQTHGLPLYLFPISVEKLLCAHCCRTNRPVTSVSKPTDKVLQMLIHFLLGASPFPQLIGNSSTRISSTIPALPPLWHMNSLVNRQRYDY